MMHRRDFLIGSAMLATGAAASVGAAKEKIRCGIIGLGHAHALDVVRVLKASEDFEIAAICEPDKAVREKVAKNPLLKGLQWLDRDRLLADNSIQAVAVESAVPQLLEHAQAAAGAARHIHLDKPAGMALPPFRALLDTMQQKNLLLQMGYMFRYNAGFDFVRKAVNDGLIGDVYRINACMDTDYGADKRGILLGRPGGLMFELGCHLLDITMVILGTPNKVTPFLRKDAPFDDTLLDNTAAVFEFDNAVAILQSSAMRPNAFATRRFEICGTDGSITVEPLEPPSVRLNLREARGGFKRGLQQVSVPDHDRHVRDFQDFARCIRGEAEFAYSKQHDYEVQRALLAACGVG